jgi:spermidine synthase
MTTEVLESPPLVDELLRQPRSTVPLLLFVATSFLSAFLLFQVQLIVNKHILPWFGGSAAVWTTSMLVFQLLLLGGYVYSHLVTTRLSPFAQFTLHAVVLSAAVALIIASSLLWPSAITPGAGWKSVQAGHPIASVCLIILVSTGLPFFVLSTSAPLLQSWFSRLGYQDKAYRLYALSNVGSLLGLLSFPFIVEPALGSKMQGRLWAILFCLFVAACLLCGRQFRNYGEPLEHALPETEAPDLLPRWRQRVNYLLWFALAACASSLLLATTNLLCQEVITVPLLWVLPLSLYLFSFILCFDHPRWYQRTVFHPLFPVALFLTCAALQSHQSFLARLLSPLLLLFATCMICHGELVSLKPGVTHLTSFYLIIAAGGAAGGLFVAVLAPRLFTSSLEFQVTLGFAVALLLATLLLDRRSWIYSGGFLLPLASLAGAIALAYGLALWFPEVNKVLNSIKFYPAILLMGTAVVLGGLVFERSSASANTWFRFIQIMVVAVGLGSFVALYYSAQPRAHQLLSARNFYGVVQVFRDGNLKELIVGETAHGAQLEPPDQRFPLLYYGPDSGIGVAMRNHPKRSTWSSNLRIGVVGLGVGTLAAYGQPGDSIRFYELDPNVVKLTSGEQAAFTYLRDSAASITTVLGDARLSLEREAAEGRTGQFDVLALDAFSGDAIPVHLLTQQAFETYWRQLASDQGIIAVHITSRHVDLVPVLIGAAQHFHATWLMTYNHGNGLIFDSGWFLMSKDPQALNIPGLRSITVQYRRNLAPRLWTDDRSDVFRLLY